MKAGRMPHWRVLELQNSVCELMVHGARNQPGERSWVIVEIHLPDILGEPHNTLFIFQRAHHRFRRATGIRQEGKPFWMVPLRFMLFRHVDYHNGTVQRRMPSKRDQFSARALTAVYSSMAPRCHRYSCVTCPNRRSRCLSLNLPISKSVVRLNATDPAWPNTFQSPCARCIAAAGRGQSMGSPAAMPPSMKSKGNATKKVISAIRSHFVSCSLREVSQETLTGEKHQGSSSTAPDRPPDAASLPRGRVPRRDRAYQISRRTLHN